MKTEYNRRIFLRNTAILGIGSSLLPSVAGASSDLYKKEAGTRVGIIGADTSHVIAFTKSLNDAKAGMELGGYHIVAVYPPGSRDIESSSSRIPGYTEELKKLGVRIAGSIDELLQETDVILLETNDGRMHLEQALPVLKAGKKMFIDKPVAGSLKDAIAIYAAAEKYKVPVFSASSLRYMNKAQEVRRGLSGKVTGADTYSPAKIEKTHPDLFWYGVHGVELLFTIMGSGCKSVTRFKTDDTDVVVGKWKDNRIGTFRGTRTGAHEYGGTVFTDKATFSLGNYDGYQPLLLEIIKFFQTGIVPVTAEETLEIYAFMEAADESKRKGGAIVLIDEVIKKATKHLPKF